MANYDDNRYQQYRRSEDDWREEQNRNNRQQYNQAFGQNGDVSNRNDYGYNDDIRYQQWQQQHSGSQEKRVDSEGRHYVEPLHQGGYSPYENRSNFDQSSYDSSYQEPVQNVRPPARGYRSSQPGGHGATGSTYVDENQYGTNYGQDQRFKYQSSHYQQNRNWWDRTRDEMSSWLGDKDAGRRHRIDEIKEHFRGKGPSEYKRSEGRIREDVYERLTDDEVVDATNITVQIQGDEVILSGTVHTKEEKRRAEDVVEAVSGVRNVENRIRIDRAEDRIAYRR